MRYPRLGHSLPSSARRRIAIATTLATLFLASSALATEPPAPIRSATTATSSSTTSSTTSTPRPPTPRGPLEPAAVRLHEHQVFVVRTSRGPATPEERARKAAQALERAFEDPSSSETHVEEQPGVAVVFAGKTPIIQLTAADAEAAGDASLSVHAAAVSAAISNVMRTERKRSEIATTVFSISLLVFSALIAFLIVRRLRALLHRMRTFVERHPDRLPAFRVSGIDVVPPEAVKGGVKLALGLGGLIVQLGVLYLWLVVAFSLFESTRGHTERLTGIVLDPLSALLGRIAAALPMVVVGAIAALAVAVLVRFFGLFLTTVARGETRLGWLEQDLAEPTSAVVRFGIIVVALIFLTPLIAGGDLDQSRLLLAAFGTLGIASVPLLASAATGILIVFSRRLKVGDFVEIGGRFGRLGGVTLLDARLEDDQGCQVRVPHLLTLFHPTRVVGLHPILTVEIAIDPDASQIQAQGLLLEAARTVGTASVELVALTADGARYRISVVGAPRDGKSAVLSAIADRLRAEGIKLGRAAVETR